MRTLAPELEAVNLGSYNVVIKAKFWQSFKGVGTPTEVTDIYSFNLTATDLVIELAGNPISIYTKWVKLYRGATINGTDYTVETSYFSINKITATPSSTKIEATLLPKITINIAGDDTYTNVLTNFATACGLTASFTDASATYWNYQFLPAGKNLAMNDANNIKALLKQKYIMLCADRGNDTINFTHYRDKSAYLTADIELETADSYLNVLRTTVGYKSQKRFLWRDETTATNYDGVAGDPIHNLGYLETTDSPPVSHANNQDFSWKNLAVDLRLENNDYLAEWEADHGDGYRYALFPIEVTERFDGKKSPSWCMDIQVSQIFSNTEGGAMPSTIERVAAYTPLVSSGFDGNLTPEVNNLQALAEAVDDLPLGGSSAPATTAINDFQVGDGSGNWITKTLAQVITILGIFADAASDSIYYVRRNATWTNLKTYTDTLYATLTHASRHQSGGADAIKLDDLATPDDNTDLDASTSRHGLLKKLSNVASEFISGTGTWTRLVSAVQGLYTHGNNASVPASTTYYLALYTPGLFTTLANIAVTRACTVQNLFFSTNSVQPASGSLVVTVLKNNAATSLTITIPASGAATIYSDTTHSVSFAKGDALTIQIVNNATAASALITRTSLELLF